jgi:molybdate transport system substrate-binding protein
MKNTILRLPRKGKINQGLALFLGSLAVVILLGYLVMSPPKRLTDSDSSDSVMLFCAAGVQLPVADTIHQINEELNLKVEVLYSGTGVLLNNLRTAKKGDLYLAADTSFIDLAKSYDLIDETVPLAKIRPVIAVYKGNPKKIKSLADLLKKDIKFALANEGASIGKVSKKVLEKIGKWNEYKKKASVFKPTVNDIALDVKLKTVDAAIIWDANARQMKELEYVSVPELDKEVQEITIAVLKTCQDPATSLKVCRYLQAPEKGQKNFEKYHYEAVKGDQWKITPQLTVFSGGVNRLAIKDTITAFQEREGVEVNVNYNGCGILVSMMNGGNLPDVYFSCDSSFMVQVKEKFNPAITLTETAMVVIVPKANPKNINSIQDLTREGLKLGLAHEVKSALGKLTKDVLMELDIYKKVKANVKADSPTADFLVNQLRVGSIDASIVYAANVAKEEVRNDVKIIPIKIGKAKAVQPIAVAKDSKYPYLSKRLVHALISPDSKKQFEKVNFRWRYPGDL